MSHMTIGELEIEIVRKDIKNVHLSVLPPHGRVRIAVPRRMSAEAVRVFAVSKRAWIKKQQAQFTQQERETDREFVERESHYLWGKRYLLKIVEEERTPSVAISQGRMVLRVRPSSDTKKRSDVMEEWYRAQLRCAIPPLIEKWEKVIGVSVRGFFVQRMKTKWGSCNHRTGHIRINTELAKKPRECLEYILVHEMIHLREPTHNERFFKLLSSFMPRWQYRRDALNRLPLRREQWG